jgi:hypothetical protein
MPFTEVYWFRDKHRDVPVITWLDSVAYDERAHAKVLALIRRFEQQGFEMQRPDSDALRDGIRELRTRFGHVNYRILYAFVGKNEAVLLHGCTKEGDVQDRDIEIAKNSLALFNKNPEKYKYFEEDDDENA